MPGRFPLKCAGINPVSSSSRSILPMQRAQGRGNGADNTAAPAQRWGWGWETGSQAVQAWRISQSKHTRSAAGTAAKIGRGSADLDHTHSRLQAQSEQSILPSGHSCTLSPRIRATCQELSVSPSFYPETELIGLSLSSSQQRFSSRTQAPSPAVLGGTRPG